MTLLPRPQLAARRKHRGFSQESLANRIGVTTNTIAHWERGITSPRDRHRLPLAECLDLSLNELDFILDPNGLAAPDTDSHALPGWIIPYAMVEQSAAKKSDVEMVTIPGLLQTADYAEAVMQQHFLPTTEDEIRQRVNTRLERQAVLDRDPIPLVVASIIDESALYRVTGDNTVMAGQLEHLITLAERPTVQIQILPARSSALHCMAVGAFCLFTPLGSTTPRIACTEDLVSGYTYYKDADAIEVYTRLFDHLSKAALSPTESAGLLRTVVKERYT